MENRYYTYTLLFLLLIVNLLPSVKAQHAIVDYQEEVILTTDRNLYYPGQMLGMHALVMQLDRSDLSGLSGYIKVDLIDPEGLVYLTRSFKIKNSEIITRIQLPGTLQSGFYRIRAYTNWMRNSGNDRFGQVQIKVINPTDQNLGNYWKEKPDSSFFPVDLSAKTRSQLTIQNALPENTQSAWLLVSHTATAEPFSTVWQSRQKPVSLNNPDTSKPFHLPEIQWPVLEGVVKETTSKKPGADIELCLNVLNANFFDQTSSRHDGYFYFTLFRLENRADLIISPAFHPIPEYEIDIWSGYAPGQKWEAPDFTVSQAEIDFLKSLNVNQQLLSYYTQSSPDDSPEKDSLFERIPFFYPPDRTIIVDDYIRLASVREVIYEVVPGVSVRKTDGRERLKVYTDQGFSSTFETLVLLDGIPLIDQGAVLELRPDRIQKIEVKNQLYIHGNNLYSAIINFISPNADYAGLELPQKSKVISLILASSEPIEYHTQISENKPGHLPDLKPILFWQKLHDFNTPTFTIQTNDLRGNYVILFYGYDNQGNRFSIQRTLSVSE